MASSNGISSSHTVPLWLNNAAPAVDSSNTHPVTSAATGEVVHHFASARESDALQAVESCATAFKTWKNTSATKRRELLQRVADIFERDADEFVRLQKLETSADDAWSRNNVAGSALYLREIASRVGAATEGSIPQLDKPGAMGFIFKEPIGVVLAIPPWNAALILCTRAIATALGVGCTVVLKASELCPATHHKIVRVFVEAGLPSGVLNAVQVARPDAAQVTEAIIAHRAVRKVEFIGSAAVGRIIGQVAAKHLKPVLMELGGKCPSIVLDDADLAQAAELSAKGALMHAGQICFSTERIIVQEKVAEQFKKLLTDAVARNAGLANRSVTPGIAAHAAEVIEDAKKHNLEFLAGGTGYRDGDGNAALKPSIILEPRDGARIVDEETFGPSASLYVVSSDEAAIDRANNSSYGLNATIHSSNMERAMKMAKELEYGQVHINSISLFVAATGSQGGVKGSGWGRQNASFGLEEFVQTKFVSWHGKA